MYSVHKQFPTLEKDLAESERETASETGNEVNEAKDGKGGSAEEIELKSLQVETQDVGRPQETGAVETDPQETGAEETDPQETGAVETDLHETDDYYFQDPSSIGKFPKVYNMKIITCMPMHNAVFQKYLIFLFQTQVSEPFQFKSFPNMPEIWSRIERLKLKQSTWSVFNNNLFSFLYTPIIMHCMMFSNIIIVRVCVINPLQMGRRLF